MKETNNNDEISKNLAMEMKQKPQQCNKKCHNDANHFARSNHHKQKAPMECNVQHKEPRS